MDGEQQQTTIQPAWLSEHEIWERLRVALGVSMADTGASSWLTLRSWEDAIGQPLRQIEQIHDVLSSEDTTCDLLLALADAAPPTAAACQARSTAELELLLCLTLVGADALARRCEAVRCQADASLLRVGITAPLAAALVGACWFGVGLHLVRNDHAEGGLIAANVVSGFSALELGQTTMSDAVETELFAVCQTFGDSSSHRAKRVRRLKIDDRPSKSGIKAALRKLLRQQGVQLMLCLPEDQLQKLAQAPDAMQLVRDDYQLSVTAFSTATAPAPEWRDLQGDMVSLVIEPLLEKIFVGTSLPKEDALSQAKLFVSYAHKDEKWKDALVEHLGALERQGRVSIWVDTQIETGDDWLPAIEQAMEAAGVAVLLISPAFLASKFITNTEVPHLLERRKTQGVRVIPVLVRECAWETVEWLKAIQMSNGSKAPDYANELERDQVLANVARKVAQFLST